MNRLFSFFFYRKRWALTQIPLQASDEELRTYLLDGTILCGILNKLRPGSIVGILDGPNLSPDERQKNVKIFLSVLHEMGLPTFEAVELEQGSLEAVVASLITLMDHFTFKLDGRNNSPSKWSDMARNTLKQLEEEKDLLLHRSCSPREKHFSNQKFPSVLQSPIMPESSSAMSHHAGHKFHEVFQLKQGYYYDLPAARISEMMKSNSLDNAPTQSLLSVINGILDESIEKRNGEIPHRVAYLLRKVIQEIGRRISTQAEHIRNQNNLMKAREEKYQSRIRVLETLATRAGDENQIGKRQSPQMKQKVEMTNNEEKKKLKEIDIMGLIKKETSDLPIGAVEDVETRLLKEKESNDLAILKLKDGTTRLMKEKEANDLAISELKKELKVTKEVYSKRCSDLENQSQNANLALEEKIKEVEYLLLESDKKTKQLESLSEYKDKSSERKHLRLRNFVHFQIQSLKELKLNSAIMRDECATMQSVCLDEFDRLGSTVEELADIAKTHHAVLAENRRLYNEVQDLKGNIRVYCRVRPFLPGENEKQTTIEYIGENGELILGNPSKQGKENHRQFKFNKAFGPTSSQDEVFLDTRPLIRSILDGYNVCIFAYGQTGSGKTHTMSGPVNATEKEWGVNYRALNDLFQISRERKFFSYDIAIQMIEIYNEQVRDLLAGSSSQKKLGIWNSTQPNGLAVPDATIRPVTSTRDVIDLMQVGLNNRAVSSTALNQRSSRSHSVLTVHVKGTELETGLVFRGSLHLVDLAGSERVDRSEVTGDRLKEAQHINKSLAALGDVIFALSQKSSHVPYRNSKLTQVLQASLGGQAKTLMFVQLNPDIDSYSETLSTLKFAERVSGVELGAARSNKEGKDVKDLMDQLAFLKDAIVKKDEEIERLQILKFDRSSSTNVSGENSMRRVSSSPNVEMQQHTDEDSEGKLSDDSAHSMGIETDSSTFNSTESIQQPSFATTAESLGKKVKVSSPRVRPLHKPSVQALSPRLALKESSRLSTSSLKSTITRATTISSTKSTGKRWS